MMTSIFVCFVFIPTLKMMKTFTFLGGSTFQCSSFSHRKENLKKKNKEKLCCFPLNFSLMMIRCESLWMSLVNSRKMFRHCFIIRKCRRRLSWRDSRGRKKDENGRDFSMWDDGRRKFGNFCLRGGWYDSGGGFIRRYRFLGDFRFCLEISLISKL